MALKTYYVGRLGDTYLETPSFDELKAWMHKNMKSLDYFQFSTSDCDASYTSDGFDKILESYDSGFTQAELDQLEEEFGILV